MHGFKAYLVSPAPVLRIWAGWMALVLLALGLAGPAAAEVIRVTSLADDTVVDGQVTLREAILAANSDSSVDGSPSGNGADQIVFVMEAAVIRLAGMQLPTIQSPIAITGPGAPLQLTIDAEHRSRIFQVSSGGTLALSRMTLRHGDAGEQDGGAILNEGSLTLSACVLEANATQFDGGAIHNTGTLSISASRLSNNAGLNGAALYNSGSLELTTTILADNATGGYGGMMGGGGALLNGRNGRARVSHSTFLRNLAANGGAIVNTQSSSLTLTNCTVTQNRTINRGGGLSNYASSMQVIHSTIASNVADICDGGRGAGGGIASSSGPLSLLNTIVAGNSLGSRQTPQDVEGTVEGESAHNLIGIATGMLGISNGAAGNIVGLSAALDPVLGDPEDNGGPTPTRALLPGSPAIDAGPESCVPATDQRGVQRPQGPACDIGAFEVTAPAEPATD